MNGQRCMERGCPWRGNPKRCPWHSYPAQQDDNHAWDAANGYAKAHWNRKERR